MRARGSFSNFDELPKLRYHSKVPWNVGSRLAIRAAQPPTGVLSQVAREEGIDLLPKAVLVGGGMSCDAS